MTPLVAEWSGQDEKIVVEAQERINPTTSLTQAQAQKWWDFIGTAMVERGELSPKLKPFPTCSTSACNRCQPEWSRAAPSSNAAATLAIAEPTVGERLTAFGHARRRRERLRKIIRGTIGVATLFVIWQIMAVAYDLEQILPPPLDVARTIFNTLTLNSEHWLYGPNIYEQLASSFLRAVSGFAIAAAFAIPLGLFVGRFRAVREFSIRSFVCSIRSRALPGFRWRSYGSDSATLR